jgi:hypothetical protein
VIEQPGSRSLQLPCVLQAESIPSSAGGFAKGSEVPGNSRIKKGCLQNLSRDFSTLTRNSLGYRYTIPQWSQLLKGAFWQFLRWIR